MKRVFALIVTLVMACSLFVTANASGEKIYYPSDIKNASQGVSITATEIRNWHMQKYVVIEDIDMTGINSISVTGTARMTSSRNGEAYCFRLDSEKGEILGWVLMNESGVEKKYVNNLEYTVSGVHDIYIVANFDADGYTSVKSIGFSNEVLDIEEYVPVPDSAIIDNWHDTWVATDDMGNIIADYEEAGAPAEEDKFIGMFYWNWHSKTVTKKAFIPWKIVEKYPEAKYDFNHFAWETDARFTWDEPLYGHYDNTDYWVYRRQAVLMANADVDVVFFDYTNGHNSWHEGVNVQLEAWRDARESGVDAPKISALCSWKENQANSVKFLYLNVFRDSKYTDLWFYWDGKPLLMSGAHKSSQKYHDRTDKEFNAFLDEMYDFFTFRTSGGRNGQTGEDQFIWLECYPQHRFGSYKDGRTEFMSLGLAINESYVWGPSITGVFSDEYTKGRSYTEAFGEDWREGTYRENYFFHEQASRVLDENPAFVFVDGWNEWTAGRQGLYSGVENCFVDTYDYEGSRDIEPAKGPLGDDSYNAFVDFVRKYRGVRSAPLASEAKTIDIKGDASQWDSVGPEFINDYDDYERDSYGYCDPETKQKYHYTTNVINSISRAKVSRDAENYYFYIKTTRDIEMSDSNWLSVYINTDRNFATGFKGYDFVINRKAPGAVEKIADGAWSFTDAGTAEYSFSGDVLQIKVPKVLIGETGVTDFEFKIVDGFDPAGNILNFYTEGSVAPMGRFNYLYTEIAQTSATTADRDALYGTTIFKKGSNRMMVSGGKMYVYQPDTRITTVSENGTLYVPVNAMEDVLGYGESKFWYDNYENILHLENHDLDENDEISDYIWTYTVLGTNEARVNGRVTALSNPVKVINGVIMVPVTYLSECFGVDIYDSGDGYISVGRYGVPKASVDKVKGLI